MMIAGVIPLCSLPRGHDLFDYGVPDKLVSSVAVESEVIVPFRSRLEHAVVWSLDNAAAPSRNLKSIEAVASKDGVLTHVQRDIIDWIIEHNGGSRTTLLRPLVSFQRRMPLPKIQKTRTGLKNILHRHSELVSESSIAIAPPSSLAQRLASRLARPQRGTTLVVAPTVTLATTIAEYLCQHIPKIAATAMLLTSRSSLYDHRRVAQALLQEKTPIILVSTKIGLFAPFGYARELILCEPWSDHHKQWNREPRYDARELANMLCSHYRIPLTILNTSLPIEHWQNIVESSEPHAARTTLHIDTEAPSEARWQCWGALPHRWWNHPEHPLRSLLNTAAHRQRSVIILYNERVMRPCAFCSTCREAFRCGQCNRVLRFHPTIPELQCAFCTRPLIPSSCPTCSAPLPAPPRRSRALPALLERLEPQLPIKRVKAARELLALEPCIACVDLGLLDDCLSALWAGSTPTRAPEALLVWDPASFGTLSGYRAAEQQWHIITQCTHWANAWSIPDRAIVGLLEEHLNEALAAGDAQRFYEQELTLRERYRYPPFVDLILLDEHLKSGERSTLSSILPRLRAQLPHCDLSDPISSVPRRQHYRSRVSVLIKVPLSHRERIMEKLLTLPSRISIDPNPTHGV